MKEIKIKFGKTTATSCFGQAGNSPHTDWETKMTVTGNGRKWVTKVCNPSWWDKQEALKGLMEYGIIE